MKFVSRLRALLASTLLLSAPAPVATANASPANGELCSVQTLDGEIVASVYAYPFVDSRHASRAQQDRAGQWSTDYVPPDRTRIRNLPADRGPFRSNRGVNHFDTWLCQTSVCPRTIMLWLLANATSASPPLKS